MREYAGFAKKFKEKLKPGRASGIDSLRLPKAELTGKENNRLL
jgi:hypothetical protein